MIAWTGLESVSDWAATWIVTYALHSSLWIGAALVAARFLSSARLRELLFKGAVVGGIASAALHGQLAREGHLTLAWERVSAVPARSVIGLDGAPVPALATAPAALDGATPSSNQGGLAGASAPSTPGSAAWPPTWSEVVFALWLAGAAWGLALVVRSRTRLQRLLAGRRPLLDGPLHEQLRGIERVADTRLSSRLSASSVLMSPLAVGSLRSGEICVPERVLTDLTNDERASLLAHELAHVSRRDPLWQLALLVLERVFFFQPLGRIAARRIEREAEFICDELAMRWTSPAGDSGLALARCLGEIAAWRDQDTPRLASAMVARHSQLVQRVERALAGTPERPSRIQFAGLGVGLAAWLALLACGGPGLATDLHQDPTTPAADRNEELAALGTTRGNDGGEQESGAGNTDVFERLRALGYVEVERSPAGDIEIVISREGTIDITQVQPFEGSGVPGVPGLTIARETHVELQDEKAFEKLAGVLKVMVSQLDKAPLIKGDPTSPMMPSVRLRIEADGTHAFRTVQKIMAVCGNRDVLIWNIVLVVRSSKGEKRAFVTPLVGHDKPGADGTVDTGAPRGRVEVSIEVVEEGRRVDVETGEAWTGGGPFRFENRILTYRVTADGRGGEMPPIEEVIDEAPELAPTISVQVREPRSLDLALELAKKDYPNASVTITAKPGTVCGDVAAVLDLVVPRFSPILFVGAH